MADVYTKLVKNLTLEVAAVETKGITDLDDLIPSGFVEPREMLTLVFRRLINDRTHALVSKDLAVQEANEMKLELTTAQANAQDFKQQSKQFEKDAIKCQAQVTDYQKRVAFLGDRWEKLTGEVNEHLKSDPNVEAAALRGEAASLRTAKFQAELQIKVLTRELATMKTRNEEQGRLLGRWSGEVLSNRQHTDKFQLEEVGIQRDLAKANADASTAATRQREAEEAEREFKKKFEETRDKLSEANKKFGLLEDTVKVKNKQMAKMDQERLDSIAISKKIAADNASLAGDWEATQGMLTEFRGKYDSSQALLHDTERRREDASALLQKEERNVQILEAKYKAENKRANDFDFELRSVKKRLDEEIAQTALLTRKIDSSTDEIVATNAKLAAAKEEKDQFAAKLANAQEELRQAHSEIDDLRGNYHRVKQRADDNKLREQQRGAEARQLEQDLRGSQVQLRTAMDNTTKDSVLIKQRANDLVKASETIADLRANVARLEEELRVEQSKVVASNKKAAEAESSLKERSQQLEASRKEVKERLSEIRVLDREKAKGLGELQASKADASAMHGVGSQLKRQLREAEEKLHTSTQRADALAVDLNASQKECAALKEEVLRLQSASSKLSVEIGAVRADKQELGGAKARLNSDLSATTQQLRTREGEIRQLRIAHEKMGEEVKTWKAKCEVAEAAIKRFETELGESRKEGLSLEARLADKQRTVDRLEAEAVPLRDRVTKCNRSTHEMAGRIEKEKGHSAGVEEDASLLRDAVVRLDLERCDLETNFEGEKAKASRLNTELQACQQELRKAQEDKSWLERAKERLEREQQDNQALRQEAERQARQLRMQLKDAKTKLVMLGGVSESAIFGEGALSTMRPTSPGGHSVVSMTSVGEMQKVLSHGVSMPQLSSKGSGIHGSSRVSFRKGG